MSVRETPSHRNKCLCVTGKDNPSKMKGWGDYDLNRRVNKTRYLVPIFFVCIEDTSFVILGLF